MQTSNGSTLENNYRINEFYMRTEDYDFHGVAYLPIYYNDELRTFMAIRFKEGYIKALNQHRLDEATKEIKRLAQYIPTIEFQKKKND